MQGWFTLFGAPSPENCTSPLLHPPQPLPRIVPAGLLDRRPVGPKLSTRPTRRIQCESCRHRATSAFPAGHLPWVLPRMSPGVTVKSETGQPLN